MPESSPSPFPAEPEFCVISRRNDSLDHRRRWSVFALLASVSLIVALSFAVVGAWPVLPYSALEIACLAVAFAIVPSAGAGRRVNSIADGCRWKSASAAWLTNRT
jgi:uncharacterized membrane protein